jgi:hypothetical protein
LGKAENRILLKWAGIQNIRARNQRNAFARDAGGIIAN